VFCPFHEITEFTLTLLYKVSRSENSEENSEESRLFTRANLVLRPALLSIKTILFDILDFWCQLEEIWFVETLSKRRMFVSFMKISTCWFLLSLIKFNKICWEKRPVKLRPNLQTSFWRNDLKNTQPHRKVGLGIWEFLAISRRLISKIRFPHPTSQKNMPKSIVCQIFKL